MSKSARKHRPSKKPHKPHPEPKPTPGFNIKSPAVAIIIAAILAAIPFSMGKYIEFNSPDPFDSGSYVYSAQHIINGARIGIDEKPSAQMGTLLINILGVRLSGYNEIGPKLIQMILQAGAFVLMFIAMRKLFGTLAASVGVIIASIYLSAPLIAKFGNVKEQHMIAFMIMGMSCFVLYQLNGKWWCAIPAGAFLSFAPLFKETGTSALGAVGLFLILQPLLKHNSWKKTGKDILLLVAGAAAIIVPISLWLTVQRAPIHYYPYSFLYRSFFAAHQRPEAGSGNEPAAVESEENAVEKTAIKQGLIIKLLPGYVRDSWQALDPEARKEVRLRVFRYYRLLILPIALAVGAIILRIIRIISSRKNKSKEDKQTGHDRFVLLFAVWWLLDMSFVWISPRLYEQYFLPLNASAAMLGGYLIAAYSDRAKKAASKPAWIAIGAVGLLVMMVMSLHIFRGVLRSPHSGIINRNRSTGQPERYRGYAQRLTEAKAHGKGAKNSSEVVGEYIKNNTTQDDEIYVWGWYPGIYISAQRFSPAPKAFEGTMNTLSPKVLAERIDEILNSFKDKPPMFIVDSRKNHFPWDRPPLELWPSIQNGLRLISNPPADRKQLLYALLRTLDLQQEDLTSDGFLRSDRPDGISRYDAAFAKALRARIEPAEAQRYEVMKPFRDYVMNNYKIVRIFGQHVLFQRK
ncbi:MAG: ArnT family glycosyltransferase [Planctomycetota bacterium]|jgi:4-amino-4-deoxy-L-arabinose transferase-like glycosyltransferase